MLDMLIFRSYIEKTKGIRLTNFVDTGKIVIFGVTNDCCATCKFDKAVALYSNRTLDIFHGKTLLQREVSLIPKVAKYINS